MVTFSDFGNTNLTPSLNYVKICHILLQSLQGPPILGGSSNMARKFKFHSWWCTHQTPHNFWVNFVQFCRKMHGNGTLKKSKYYAMVTILDGYFPEVTSRWLKLSYDQNHGNLAIHQCIFDFSFHHRRWLWFPCYSSGFWHQKQIKYVCNELSGKDIDTILIYSSLSQRLHEWSR